MRKGSSERRTLSGLTVYDEGNLAQIEEQLWYDKIFKVRRGLYVNGTRYQPTVFTGMLSTVDRKHFGKGAAVTLTDLSKLLNYNFADSEEYGANDPLETTLRDMAIAGGLPAAWINMPSTGEDIGDSPVVYTQSDNRWSSMRQLAEERNYDLFFTADGILTIAEYPRLDDNAVDYLFTTGEGGNIGEHTKKQTDKPIRNIIIVTGAKIDDSDEVYSGRAENLTGDSTSVDVLSERPETIEVTTLTSNVACQAHAEMLLEDYGREQFEVSSVVIPDFRWEANTIVQFDRPDPNGAEVNRYILDSFSIPLEVGPASINVSRMQR